MKIYIVTEGNYSDYHIISIHSDKTKAEEVAKSFLGGVEEWELNDENFISKLSETIFDVDMTEEGVVTKVTKVKKQVFDAIDEFAFDNAITGWVASYKGTHEGEEVYKISMYVFAKDEKHAIKLVNEKRLFLISNNMFKKDKNNK